MKKLFLFLFLALTSVLFLTSTSYASVKNPKDGISQSAGCNTKSLNYHYTLSDPNNPDSKGRVVYGKLTVGVCANEHYSTSSHKYVAQADVYMSETGAYTPCFANFYLQKVDHRFIFGDSNVSRTYFDCHPAHTSFNWHFQGLTVPLIDSGSNKTLGQRYYGQIIASYSFPVNSVEYNNEGPDTVTSLDFNGPSVTMK